MKKTLIALTLASLSVAAVADVTIYGNIRAGVYNYSNKYTANINGTEYSTPRHSVTGIDDVGSYIGFKGSEDVAGGLKAIWQVENAIYDNGADHTTGSWAGRDTFIGLEGGFGKVRIGKMKSQFGSHMGSVDQWEYNAEAADTQVTAIGLARYTRTDVRLANAARYDSPVWGGFSFNLTHGVDEYKRLNHDGSDYREGNLRTTVLGLNYENAGWFAQYGFGLYGDSYLKDSKLKDGQAHRLEVGYNANNLFVGLGWQYTKGFSGRNGTGSEVAATATVPAHFSFSGGDGEAYKGHELALSAAYTFGALTPKITYAHGFKQKLIDGGDKLKDSDYNQVILGLDYALSKRTTAMLSAGWLKGGAGLDMGNGHAYVIVDPANNPIGAAEQTVYSYGIGLRHLF